MKFEKFLNTWEGLQFEKQWQRIFTAILLLIVLLMSINLFRKDTIVVFHPDTPANGSWVAKNKASQSYKEAWGLCLAQLIGNVTPASLEFINERLQLLLSPKVYQEVIDELNMQSQHIKNDRLSLRFEPKSVEYEAETGKVFVSGTSFENRVGGRDEYRSDRTYEFMIIINNYGPVITSIGTYSGPPKIKGGEEQQETAANVAH